MTVDPRAALDRLVSALEAHYHAIAARRRDDDPAVDDAYDVLADAFEVYDDALSTVFGETTPFDLVDDEDDEDESGDDEDRLPEESFEDEYDDVVLVDEANVTVPDDSRAAT